MKRKRAGNDQGATTSKKVRADDLDDELGDENTTGTPRIATPSNRKAGKQDVSPEVTPMRPNGRINGLTNGRATPKSLRKLLFSTPTKPAHESSQNGTPTIVRNADRSARRKSAKRLIERTISGDHSDQEVSDEEDALAQQIWEEEDDEAADGDELGTIDEDALPETPSKRGRGRPKGKRQKQRSPTPPQNLPPHEQYFWENRPGGTKTSNNTLASTSLLTHDEYFAQMRSYTDPHASEHSFLLSLHARSFDQWLFELKYGFNICLYGYGSKRELIQRFAHHLHTSLPTPPKTMIVNGYNSGTTIRDILCTLASLVLPKEQQAKLPAQPTALLQLILGALPTPPTIPSAEAKIYLLINSLDAASLRRPPSHALLSQLCAHPSIALLATADHPNFPLLWDHGQRARFRFCFHDATTFAPYAAELDVVDAVNELLGRSGRRVGGRDGVAFVLRSLPENARGLYRILVAEQLAGLAMDDDDEAGGGEQQRDELAEAPIVDGLRTPAVAARKAKAEARQAKLGMGPGGEGVEYRVLYHKAVEEFVCSNEHGFRTLLKEFYDHQMVESRRDAMGTERLVVPFRREELEGLLEELVS